MDDPRSGGNLSRAISGVESNLKKRSHSAAVIYVFYFLLFLFLLSFISSIVIATLLATTRHKLSFDIDADESGEGLQFTESPGVGQFGSTATAIVLIGFPLLILLVIVCYAHLFNMKDYFSPKV
jgi:hypothetical protein